MTELLEKLCNTDSISGDEKSVRDLIISQIDGFCEWKIDNLGNIIAFKKGKKTPERKIMLDAHMDEVGLIVTNITPHGFLQFTAVGGIDVSALMFRNVKINGKINGVISGKPIHLVDSEERKKLPEIDDLYIDIGAESKDEAEDYVSIGDSVCFDTKFYQKDNAILSKAIDDRAGCAIIIDIIRNFDEFDFYASFSVQEEVGLRGAKVSTYAINPDCAIALESTTAADIADVPYEKQVCNVGKGPVVSFMDKATVYDKEFYNAAMKSGIPCQSKRAVAGGNNSGVIHLCREGVRTVAISLPCRYIHSSSSVTSEEDYKNAKDLALYMLRGIASGEIK